MYILMSQLFSLKFKDLKKITHFEKSLVQEYQWDDKLTLTCKTIWGPNFRSLSKSVLKVSAMKDRVS